MVVDQQQSIAKQRSEKITAWLAVATAVLTLLTTLLGYLTVRAGQAKTTAESKADSLTSEIAEKQAQLDDVTAALKRLQASVSPMPTAPSPSGQAGKQLREDQLTVADEYCLDLDTQALNWRVHRCVGGRGTPDDDLLVSDFSAAIVGQNNVDFSIVDAASPDAFETCDSSTAYATELRVKQIPVGTRICARTTERNYAMLRVDRIDGSSTSLQSIAFSVRVWKR